MKKIIEFGKIDFNGSGRKNCIVDVEIKLRDTNQGPEFSVCGNIWNTKHTDIYCGGQCLDTIAKYVHTPLFKEIYELWQKYHLNGLHAGTIEQEEALVNCPKKDYTTQCAYLDDIGLYEVPYDGPEADKNGMYQYGSAWLYRTIPDDVLVRMKEIINMGK